MPIRASEGTCGTGRLSEDLKAMASSAHSQYLLRWNDHLTNYGDILFSLREQEEFVDCSIACEDGLVGAHRVVLAGCSSYLRDLFARIHNPHPVIFLLNTPRSLVLMLMEFIYRGQVHIPQHRLQQLVVLGQALKIKGLTQIMMPVSSTLSSPNENCNSITPLAFPHGLPLTGTNTLPFTSIPTSTSSMDISVLSCTNGQQTVEEEEEEVGKGTMVDEEEEEEKMESKVRKNGEGKDMRLRRQSTTGRPRGRPRQLGSPQKRTIGTRGVVPSKKTTPSPLKSYLTTIRDKVDIGAFAVNHGMQDTKRYVLEKYNINARDKTLERLIEWYQEYLLSKENKAILKLQRKK